MVRREPYCLKAWMLADFPAPPDTNFTVSYIDDCVADYLAPAYYVVTPIDDYSNNSIYINETTDTSDISYFTTLAHEGFPGHLYQTLYYGNQNPVPSVHGSENPTHLPRSSAARIQAEKRSHV